MSLSIVFLAVADKQRRVGRRVAAVVVVVDVVWVRDFWMREETRACFSAVRTVRV